MNRPLFCVAVVRVSDEDRSWAQRLGRELYRVLTRDPDDPLSFGPGIPVAIDIDLTNHATQHTDVLDEHERDADGQPQGLAVLAEHVLLVMVAGTSSLLLEPDETVHRLNQYDGKHVRLTKLLVPSDRRWFGESKRFANVGIADSVLGKDDISTVVDSVLKTMGECFFNIHVESDAGKRFQLTRPHFFLSKTAAEPDPEGGKVSLQSAGAKRSPLWQYFASIDSFDNAVVDQAVQSQARLAAVLVSLQSYQPGETRLQNREIIVAKKQGWPIVWVPPRSWVFPAIDTTENEGTATGALAGQCFVPKRRILHWETLLRLAAVEHLRHVHFHLIADRIIEAAQLPVNTAVIGRAPELLDLTSGPLRNARTRTVLHPDPALTPESREVLRAAAPLLHPVTPSTLMGRGIVKNASGRLVTPLDGIRVGFSVSNFRADDFRLGQTPLHLQDATVQITRVLIGGGASISYGGGFKTGRATSMAPLLGELIETYNETAISPAQRLRVFQAATSKLENVPEAVRCQIRHLGKSRDLVDARIFSTEELAMLPFGLVYSEMRAAMTAETDARVAIGGQTLPRDIERGAGYGGRFPGIAEEVYRAIQTGQPVYLCGGFGGLTGRLTRLMQQREDGDAFWDERTYGGNRRFASLVWDFDHHPKRGQLNLPANLLALAKSIAKFAKTLGDDDTQWRKFNGLDRRQNEVLWSATDPILLSSLVSEGLMRWRALRTVREGKLRIEAIHGNVTSVTRADVLALPVFDDVDPQGAGAAIDRITGGMVRQAQSQSGNLIGVRSDQLDVDYLCAVSLGKVSENNETMTKVREAIIDGAREMMLKCRAEGFHSLAVVTFGGSTLNRYEDAVQAMLAGFKSHPDDLLIKWVEADEDRFNQLLQVLRQHDDTDVTTVLKPIQADPPTAYPWFNLTIKYKNGLLDVTALPQRGTGVAWTHAVELDPQTLLHFAKGSGASGKQTPSQAEIRQRGKELARLLFADNVDDFWQQCQNCPIAITHNAAASQIPFEMMRFGGGDLVDGAPAIRGGIHRWLAVGGSRISTSFGGPRLSRKLSVGLVIDPTNNLAGARREGLAIKRTLVAMGNDVQLICLGEGDGDEPATREAVIGMLQQVDVLHYCGHAFFDENDRTRSGLLLKGNEILTAQDLSSLTPIPRVVIFNACEAGRVRGETKPQQHASYSLAEMVLRSGVEAFIGTFWEVKDEAAATFALSIYNGLTAGLTLRDSVTEARKKLALAEQNDWANYILYGDGRFRLA